MPRSYAATVLQHWDEFVRLLGENEPQALTGTNLPVSLVVAVARYGVQVGSNNDVLAKLDQQHEVLKTSISNGDIVYGVNTGFGGSANTRTSKVNELQRGLLREFNSGILLPSSHPASSEQNSLQAKGEGRQAAFEGHLSKGLAIDHLESINCMPASWVRAAMIIRINSLLGGYSGVRSALVEQMYKLLGNDIIPRIPIHGSISASGDLSPLSYIGSAVQGSPNISCTVGYLDGKPKITDAKTALNEAGMRPVEVVSKEGLAIMNGTAISTGVGALAMHDAHCLAILAQILTAMSVESLRGSAESFDPLFARLRPHPGQIDSSHNIFRFLKGSKLLSDQKPDETTSLKQDRYSIRTAAQWLGPVLEDLLLAHDQISTECNSVTDNPLIEATSRSTYRHFHGGNFQARSVTSAMDKTRQSLQSIGRMLFAQCTEIINPATNFGLPPNLVADEPSESFMFKSIDITIASLTSELGFLANPVGSHVQTAEMGNQALNSLALISGRYTISAVDLVSKLVAAHLLVTCQALDLRVMDELFFEKTRSKIHALAGLWHRCALPYIYYDRDVENPHVDLLTGQFLRHLRSELDKTTALDSKDRFKAIATSFQPLLLAHFIFMHEQPEKQRTALGVERDVPTSQIVAWTESAEETLYRLFHETREVYLNSPGSVAAEAHYLGSASKRMYNYVRHELGVPFLTTAVLTGQSRCKDDATADTDTNMDRIGSGHDLAPDSESAREKTTTPTMTTTASKNDNGTANEDSGGEEKWSDQIVKEDEEDMSVNVKVKVKVEVDEEDGKEDDDGDDDDYNHNHLHRGKGKGKKMVRVNGGEMEIEAYESSSSFNLNDEKINTDTDTDAKAHVGPKFKDEKTITDTDTDAKAHVGPKSRVKEPADTQIDTKDKKNANTNANANVEPEPKSKDKEQTPNLKSEKMHDDKKEEKQQQQRHAPPPPPSIGEYMTRIYSALRSGEAYGVAFECWREVVRGVDGGHGEGGTGEAGNGEGGNGEARNGEERSGEGNDDDDDDDDDDGVLV